jgi:hypothetical protein
LPSGVVEQGQSLLPLLATRRQSGQGEPGFHPIGMPIAGRFEEELRLIRPVADDQDLGTEDCRLARIGRVVLRRGDEIVDFFPRASLDRQAKVTLDQQPYQEWPGLVGQGEDRAVLLDRPVGLALSRHGRG